MNSLRIRVGTLDPSNCRDHAEYSHAVFISQDSLMWWPINRFKTFDEALGYAKGFTEFIKTNQLIKLSSIIWENKL